MNIQLLFLQYLISVLILINNLDDIILPQIRTGNRESGFVRFLEQDPGTVKKEKKSNLDDNEVWVNVKLKDISNILTFIIFFSSQ